MSGTTEALTRQLLEWISDRPRTYAEAMEAWRTSCPKLSIWEDACIAGLIGPQTFGGFVTVSAKGRRLMNKETR
jgi:hypothetical protein